MRVVIKDPGSRNTLLQAVADGRTGVGFSRQDAVFHGGLPAVIESGLHTGIRQEATIQARDDESALCVGDEADVVHVGKAVIDDDLDASDSRGNGVFVEKDVG